MSDQPTASDVSFSIFVRNARSSAVTFVLEPWGEVYPMPAGASFEVRATGPSAGNLEVEHGEQSITVYGWSGSVIAVLCEGVDLAGPSVGPRSIVPTALPPGMSISRFVKSMFGGPAP